MKQRVAIKSWSGMRFLTTPLNMVALFVFAALLLTQIPILPLADPTVCRAGQEDQEAKTPQPFIAHREFRGALRRDMAERIAKTAAELAAYEHASRLLAGEGDVRFAAGGEDNIALSLDGLARIVFKVKLTAIGAEGSYPFRFSVVHMVLKRQEPFRERLLAGLTRERDLETYGQLTARQRELVGRYDGMVPSLLSLPPSGEGGREQLFALQAIVNELAGIELYDKFLSEGDKATKDAASARDRLLRVETLAPRNAMILNTLAEIQLRLDRPFVALEYADRALRETPSFARAHDTRGAILLRQRLPKVAIQDFDKAIAWAPRNASYYMSRSMAYLMLEDFSAMCADLQQACALGDCEGLDWATGSRRCSRGTP